MHANYLTAILLIVLASFVWANDQDGPNSGAVDSKNQLDDENILLGHVGEEGNLPMLSEEDESEDGFEKRGWNDLQAAWGKRAWNDLQAAWGKRGWRDFPATWGKRGWQNLQGAWGKRDGDWRAFRGSWGKREPSWNNLKGLWGKRADNNWGKLNGVWGKRSVTK